MTADGEGGGGALDRFTRSPEERIAFAEEQAMAQVAIAFAALLSGTDIGRAFLETYTGRVGDAGAREISSVLLADGNLTVRTMAKIAHALGHRLVISFVPVDEGSS
jgi:hypothetical protein